MVDRDEVDGTYTPLPVEFFVFGAFFEQGVGCLGGAIDLASWFISLAR